MRVAIVGSGISGLTALWVLKKHSDHEVNIYESADRVGGQAVGVEPGSRGEDSHSQQSANIAHGRASEDLAQLLDLLEIPRADANVSMSVTSDGVAKKWSVGDILNPRSWRFALDLLRFRSSAPGLLQKDSDDTEDSSLRAFLDREGYVPELFNDYLLPLITLLFLVPDDLTALELPATVVIKRLQDEGILNKTQSWFTIEGGPQRLAQSLASVVPSENLHLNSEIVSVSSEEHGVRLVEANGNHHIYDHVIMALPADKTHAILQRGGWVSETEAKVFNAMKWQTIDTEVNDEESHGPNGSAVPKDKTNNPPIQFISSPAPPGYEDAQAERTQHTSLIVDTSAVQNTAPARYLTVNPTSTHGQRQRWSVPFPTASTASDLSHLAEIENRRISYISWNNTVGGAVASAVEVTSRTPFNATPPFPARKSGSLGTGLALRLVAQNSDRARRLLSPLWPIFALPMAIVLAIVETAVRPLSKPLPGLVRGVKRLRKAWALF